MLANKIKSRCAACGDPTLGFVTWNHGSNTAVHCCPACYSSGKFRAWVRHSQEIIHRAQCAIEATGNLLEDRKRGEQALWGETRLEGDVHPAEARRWGAPIPGSRGNVLAGSVR